jgi:hypothetical protein
MELTEDVFCSFSIADVMVCGMGEVLWSNSVRPELLPLPAHHPRLGTRVLGTRHSVGNPSHICGKSKQKLLATQVADADFFMLHITNAKLDDDELVPTEMSEAHNGPS